VPEKVGVQRKVPSRVTCCRKSDSEEAAWRSRGGF
jgi:hypothetical protein